MKRMALVCGIVCVVMGAAAGQQGDLADVLTGSNGVIWQPLAGFSKLILSVATPDGQVIERAFAAGSTPYLNLSDAGKHFTDGQYTWELRAVTTNDPALVQSGHFLVSEGAVVDPNAEEPDSADAAKAADGTKITYGEDLIVAANLCAGGNCVTGEIFGNYNTIKVKYDNVRLAFDDTSSALGYPANDWRIVINDPTNGGGNYFAVEDTTAATVPLKIEAGAPASAVYVTSSGRVGIGTATPGWPMHIERTGINSCITVRRTDGATNFINATDAYANFGAVTNHPLRLLVNSVWKLRLNTDNSLSMASGASCTVGGTWTNASSRELKENIQGLTTEEAVKTLGGLNPVKFAYKADKDEKHVGFIAEDVPDLVATKDRKGMSPMDVTAVLTKVVQEQQKTIAELKSRIEALEKEKPAAR